MRLERASGILLHLTSLPGRYGIGDLGPGAEAFLEFLSATGQHWWQVLPFNPTGAGNSPYQAHSSYAGEPLLISPDLLEVEGLLDSSDLRSYPRLSDDRVDYPAVRSAKAALFRRAFARFGERDPGFGDFVEANTAWVDDYALYMALKDAHGGRAWNEWPADVAAREPGALAEWRERLAGAVRYHQFLQYLFDRQWRRLRRLARDRRVSMIGDVPIFASLDSSDVWARPDLFQLDDAGRPTVVAGVPPDYFSEDGQRWGNPLYRWEAHAAEGFAWWAERLRACVHRVDLVRLDHFRGFEAFWEVPAEAPTAATGRWAKAPGRALLEAVRARLGGLPLIAEDLGEITPQVLSLRDDFGLPGMKVLQFAFGNDPMAEQYLPYAYPNHCVVYPGTHDNDTTLGWFTCELGQTTQSEEEVLDERAFIRRFVGASARSSPFEVVWGLVRAALSSVADTAIIPLQDVLGLGSEGRMNFPGEASGQWEWRFRSEQLDGDVRHRLADITAAYGRWRGEVPEAYRSPRKPRGESL
jgi:4-alpha-glucanotransferase